MSKLIAVNASDTRYKDGSITKFAGMWKDINSKKIKKYVHEGRRDRGKSKSE